MTREEIFRFRNNLVKPFSINPVFTRYDVSIGSDKCTERGIFVAISVYRIFYRIAPKINLLADFIILPLATITARSFPNYPLAMNVNSIFCDCAGDPAA